MKTMIAKVATVAALLLAASAARAQGYTTYRPRSSMMMFNYEMSKGVGDFEDFISAESWRGFSFEYRSMVAQRFSAGVSFGYNRFEQTKDLTVERATGGILSGKVYRYADQIPVKLLLHGYLLDGPISPYAGVGIGGVWSYAYSQIADLSIADNSFGFIVSPEVGLTLTAAKGASSVGLNVALRYNYTTNDINASGKVNDVQWLSIVVGLFGSY